jgi:phage antirepressor YoqD-like protein
MKHLDGLDIRDAAKDLNIGQRRLLRELADMGAIEKTRFGWTAHHKYKNRGLLKTSTRQTQFRTETGTPIKKIYTVVVITGDGLNWLKHTLNTEARQ